MHIPDNYLSPSTCAAMGAVMLPIWTKVVNRVKNTITRKKMPLMGIGAAFSFLIMMFNVPLPGGTTGHAVGGTLLAILLGPEAACISISIALLLQALLFGDGGILAIGANCFNIAFVIPFAGYFIYRFLKKVIKSSKGEYVSIFIAAYLALNLGALFTAVEFGLQPMLFKDAQGLPMYCPYPLSIAVPAMLLPHLLVAGVVEGVVTAAVYGFVKKVSPGTLVEGLEIRLRPLYILLISMILLTPLGLLATGTAWGEWGNEEISTVVSGGKALGYVPKGMSEGFSFHALIPDYSVEAVPEVVGYILAAIAGVAILLIVFKLLSNRKTKRV